MEKNIDKLRLQLQIAIIVYENQNKFSDNDLAHKFFISDSSFRRNICALRKAGIAIHSRKHTLFILCDGPQRKRLRRVLKMISVIEKQMEKL